MGRRSAAEASAAPPGTCERHLSARAAGIGSIAGYLLSVAVLEVTRRTVGFPEPADIALSPAALAAGKVWLLFTSALLVSGPPLLEIMGLTLAVALLVDREGPASFWRAAFAGHIGGTLFVYAGVGLLWLFARSTVTGVLHYQDYGVSGVWLGVLGALAASIWLRERPQGLSTRASVALGLCLLAVLIGATLFPALGDAEHTTAFIFGAALEAAALTPASFAW